LVAVLQARLSAVEGRAGLKIKFKSDLTERVSIVIEEGLCHIAQEALNNVLKHAHAQNISVHVGLMDGKITLTVIDDGVGFDLKTVSQGGLGLGSMREHAEAIGGKLSVFSQPNHGTKVTVEVEL
jgi:signal transduction histidine kinase